MKKVSVIGLFSTGKEVSDGQSIKTRIITQELEKALGAENVRRIDTYGWKKNPASLFSRCIGTVQKSDHVIFMTDAGGIKVFPWLLHLANFRRRAKLHYVVVGGWLVPFLRKNAFLSLCLKKLDGVFVETSVMEKGLKELGFYNVLLMPNCKPLTLLTEEELREKTGTPVRFCIFSRIMREKGVEDAVTAVRKLNARYGRTVCTLDLFGQVDPEQREWFEELSAAFPPEIRYGGVIPYDRSVQTIRRYHVLLFPTRFYTEGIPGTIIDAYAAGVPVVASAWESVSDIVEHGQTGYVYPFEDVSRFEEILSRIVENPGEPDQMRRECLRRAQRYLPERVMEILLSEL